MKIERRLKLALTKLKDDVFLRQEFDRYASKSCVARGLSALTREGVLVKLGRGIYARGKPSTLTGRPIPSKPVEVLAPIALQKMGIKVRPSHYANAYNDGASTQIPAGISLNVGRSRVSRQIGFGSQKIRYEKDKRNSA